MKKLLVLFVVCAQALALPASAFETKAKQAILMDYNSGDVLYEKNADEKMHPSSMSKLMTTYIVLKRLKEGSLKLSDTFVVSEKAWRMQGSKMFVELGNSISVEDLLKGIVIQSGNDACIVIAEGISGTEEAFAGLLNQTAKELGMNNSHFTNSTGWPDDQHQTTARDLAILAKHLIDDFPEYYPMFSQHDFVYHGIKQGNRNLLLYKNIGVDGLKTGHTEVAGYGITVSGVSADKKRRMILVVNGLKSEKERAEQAELLLAHGFRDFQQKQIFAQGQVIENAPVWFGNAKTVPVVAQSPVSLNLPVANKASIKLKLAYQSPVTAPIKKGDKIGDVTISVPGRSDIIIPAVAAQDVDGLGAAARILPTIEHLIFGRNG